MTETKQCSKCQLDRPLVMFSSHKRDGLQAWCKDCMRDYAREYKKRPQYREYRKAHSHDARAVGGRKEYNREYQQRPEVKARRAKSRIHRRSDPVVRGKLEARRFARTAVRNGTIQKLPCANCGIEQSQQHHPDYDEPLLIVWLCRDCHIELHRRANE